MSSENHDEVTALRELLAEQAERVGQLEGELADSQAELDEVWRRARADMRAALARADRAEKERDEAMASEKTALDDALKLLRERDRAIKLSKQLERAYSERELVCAQRDAFKAELDAIRAERERAQARLCGHPSYGEGAVADGPGTPHASDLRELAEGVAGLVGMFQSLVSPTVAMRMNAASMQMRDAFSPPTPVDDDDDDGLGACFDAALERDKALGFVCTDPSCDGGAAHRPRDGCPMGRHACGCEVGRPHECVGHGAG